MQHISIRFLQFKGFLSKRMAFASMGHSLSKPWQANGLVFAKHMGVGKGNGFSLWPDFSMYAFLGVFESEAKANSFFAENVRWNKLASIASEIKEFNGFAIKGHGTWNGKQPFEWQELPADFTGKVAVITRASIRWSQAWRFWMNVPSASKHIDQQVGLVLAKGVGELPLVEQATISIWDSIQSLEQFAYKTRQHAQMIKKTREYNWYKEEMFIRIALPQTITHNS